MTDRRHFHMREILPPVPTGPRAPHSRVRDIFTHAERQHQRQEADRQRRAEVVRRLLHELEAYHHHPTVPQRDRPTPIGAGRHFTFVDDPRTFVEEQFGNIRNVETGERVLDPREPRNYPSYQRGRPLERRVRHELRNLFNIPTEEENPR